MILSPEEYSAASTGELLRAAARGHAALDHRLLRAVLDRGEAVAADILRFFEEERPDDRIDIEEDLLAIVRQLRTPASLPFLMAFARRYGFHFPEALTSAFLELGAASVEPLLDLFEESDNAEDVAFALASLRVRDPRILTVLTGLLSSDPLEASLYLGIYGDPAARPALEEALVKAAPEDDLVRRELASAIREIERGAPAESPAPYDIWPDYPVEDDPAFDVLSPEEVREFLGSPAPEYRVGAVQVLTSSGTPDELIGRIMALAKSNPDVRVRAACWEAMEGSLDEPGVRAAMLARLEDTAAPLEERCGALVGLALEAGEKDAVRRRILEFYTIPEARAQAIKAMWRSMDGRFAKYIPPHLDDPDKDVRFQAVWAVGWLGIVSQLGRLEQFFDDKDLRDSALFAYALAAPSGNSRAQIRKLFRKIDDLSGGLSQEEGKLVRNALDNRLRLHGEQPVFEDVENWDEEEDPPPAPVTSAKAGRNDPCPCGSGKKYKKCCGQ